MSKLSSSRSTVRLSNLTPLRVSADHLVGKIESAVSVGFIAVTGLLTCAVFALLAQDFGFRMQCLLESSPSWF